MKYKIGMELTIPTYEEIVNHFGLNEDGDTNTIKPIRKHVYEKQYCGKTLTIIGIKTYPNHKTFKFKLPGEIYAWFSNDIFEFKIKETKGNIMKLNVGDTVLIPPLEVIIDHFGTNNNGSTETRYSISNSSDMFKMCGHEHEIIEIDDSGYMFKDENKRSWWFPFDIFNFEYVKDTRTERDYVGRDKLININTTIINQIKHRYELVDADYLSPSESKYGIIDTLYPYSKLYQEQKKTTNIRKGKVGQVAISEKISKEFEVPQLKIEDLIAILGYSKHNIHTILNKVKSKKLKLAVVGYGGTGTNFLHWLSQLALMTNTRDIFRDLILSDNDYFDTVNLLRIPFILPEFGTKKLKKKVYFFQDYANIFSNINIFDYNITKENIYDEFIMEHQT